MSSPFNVTIQNPDVQYLETLNKSVYDQKVLIQPTISYMDAYALMPTDNSGTTIAVGADLLLPRLGSTSNSDIIPASSSSFTLGPIGVYEVSFQVGITTAGQFVLTLNGTQLPNTVFGTDTSGTIMGKSIITTSTANSVLTVRNPTGNASALTITPYLGGTQAVSAHLIIIRLR